MQELVAQVNRTPRPSAVLPSLLPARGGVISCALRNVPPARSGLGKSLVNPATSAWQVSWSDVIPRRLATDLAIHAADRIAGWPCRRDWRIARCGVQSTPQIQIHIPGHMPVAGFRAVYGFHTASRGIAGGPGRAHLRARPLCRVLLKAHWCASRTLSASGQRCPHRGPCGQRLRRGAHPSVSLEVQPQKRACALESFPRRCRSYAQVITDLLKEESSTARI